MHKINRYLQCFDMCGICRSDIETLHEGLKHPLLEDNSRYYTSCVTARHLYCSAVQRQTYLSLNGHCGDILKHNVLHLSLQKRNKIT